MTDTATGGSAGHPPQDGLSPAEPAQPTAASAEAPEGDRLATASSGLSPRPYVRSASADQPATGAPQNAVPAPPRPAGLSAARNRGRGEGALRASFADLAARAASDGAGEVAVYGRAEVERHDPAAGPDGPTLLLRSVVDLREVWVPLLAAAGARSIALLGTEHGQTTALLVELLRAGGGGRLLVVDPEPGRVPAAGRGLDIDVVREYGAAGLDGHTPTDAYLIDGDANFATVARTLAAVDDAVHEFDRAAFPLILVHDVGWPTARRDRYVSPDRLTAADRQPFTWDAGVTLDRADAVPGRGLRGEGGYAWALEEGGPRNGVRSAIEEFVAGHPELRFFTVAPVFGLGIIVDRRAPYAARIAELLAPWVSNPLLSRLERNRLDLYLRVVAQRDEAMAVAQSHHRDVSRLDAERLRLIAIDIEKSDRIAELERALADERALTADALNARLEEPRLVAAARSADSRLRARFRRGPSKLEQTRARLAEEEKRRRDVLTEPGGGLLALPAGGNGASSGGAGPRALAAGPSSRESTEAPDAVATWGVPPAPNTSGPGPDIFGQGGTGPAEGAQTAASQDAARQSPEARREAADRLRGRHRLHQPATGPDVLTGGGEEQTDRLWAATRTSASPSRTAPAEPAGRSAPRDTAGRRATSAPSAPHPTRVPPGAGTGAVLLPPAPAMLPPREAMESALPPLPSVPPPPTAPPPPAGPPSAGSSASAAPSQPPQSIQSGQPIAAGQSIPPGSAVAPGQSAEAGTPGGPQLFDRSGVPRRRRMSAASQDRHEPRHRAPGRNHNPDRPS